MNSTIKSLFKSCKQVPLNIFLVIIIMLFYSLNRFYLKNLFDGWFGYILKCHFNDFLCGILFIAYSNIFLLTRNKSITKLPIIIPYTFSAGLVWEFVAPYLRQDSTSDWIDVGCYILGGITYWIIYHTYIYIKTERMNKND